MRGGSPLPLAATVTLLAAADVATTLTAHPVARAAVPIASLAVVRISRRQGASWEDLGLAPSTWRSGMACGAASAAAVSAVIATAAALPATRAAFLDDRYRNSLSKALRYALVTVPLQTVVPEEIAFRGALLTVVSNSYGQRAGAIGSSVLFGLWHIPSSLDLGTDNQALSARFGSIRRARVLGVATSVLATAAAGAVFVQLRRRTGSLLAPAALHWAFNAGAVLASAAVWRRRGSSTFG